jgi:hypothetical protein
LRLLAIAEVAWPPGLWLAAGPDPVAGPEATRMLRRARRRLGLARWHPVAVVVDPSLAMTRPDENGATGALLLARAGLVQTSVTPAARAEALFATTPVVLDPRIAPAVADHGVQLALGAALAGLPPPSDEVDAQESMEIDDVGTGWAVELMDVRMEPTGPVAAKFQ